MEAFRQSGQTTAEFARQHGVKPLRLRWWKKRLVGDGEGNEPSPAAISRAIQLAPVTVRGVMSDSVASVSVESGIRVEVQDPQAVPPEWLAEVIVALRGGRS